MMKTNNTLEIKISQPNRYRPEIDGLRAFAVIAVIINHFNNDILPGGYLGVDIFFVISGYVITSSLFGRKSKNFRDFIGGFYERRVKRLVPALSVFVLVGSVAVCLFSLDPSFSLRTGITSLFGLSNLYLFKQSTDYFARSTDMNVFTHTWSLGVEEQFYLLFPFLIWFSGFGSQSKNGARNLFFIVCMLSFASMIGFIYFYSSNQPAAYFLMPFRFWEMAVGCLIFIGFLKRASLEHFLEKVSPLLVLVLIVIVMYLPKSWAVASTVLVVFLSSVLIACLKAKTVAFKIFTHPRVVYLGLISYSLYLWHWGVLSISRWTIGIHWWSVPFQLALMLILAIISYRLIETPLRKHQWFKYRWKSLLVGIGALFGSALSVLGLSKVADNLYLGNKILASQIGNLGVLDRTQFKNSTWSIEKCVFSSMADVGRQINIDECSLRPWKKNRSTLLVIGNSQNVAQVRMYEKVSSDGFNVILTSGWGCHLPKQLKTQNQWRYSCDFYQEHVISSLVSQLKAGDIVAIISDFSVFSISDNPKLIGFDQSPKSVTVDRRFVNDTKKLSVFFEGINDLAKSLNSMGVMLIVQDMSPLTRGLPEIRECISFFKWDNKECEYQSKEDHLSARQQFHMTLRKIAERNPNVFLFDPHSALCSQKVCSYLSSDGNLLYRDSAHLSDFSSAILSPQFSNLVSNISR